MSPLPVFNCDDSDWIEYGIALLLAILALFLGAVIRYLSSIALRINTERTLLKRRNEEEGHVVIGEDRWLALLGAPHVVRTRTKIGFSFLLVVVIGTTALTIASTAFSGSRKLRTGTNTRKITALPGDPITSEDELRQFADWFRSSGVISFCQRRSGAHRIFYQPFVENSGDTKIYCGKRLDVQVVHESETSFEMIRPQRLDLKKLQGVTKSTLYSAYWIHEIDYMGKSLLAVCNSGEFYRGIRAGRISQTCAFTTKTSLILGGYVSNDTAAQGPGKPPEMSDAYLRYYDSYEVEIGTELTQTQLMQALTLWDLGTMSEIEVAALSTLRPELQDNIESFEGGYERLQIEMPMLVFGLATAGATILFLAVYIFWDQFDRPNDHRLRVDVTSMEYISKIMGMEARGERGLAQEDAPLNRLAIRDVTQYDCRHQVYSKDCPKIIHLGSHETAGKPANMRIADIVDSLNNSGY